MKLTRYTQENYNVLCSWWEKHGHPIIKHSSLSPFGLVFSKDNKDIAMSFIYFHHDCDMAQIAWTTTNPDASLRDKHTGVTHCLEGLIELARQQNRSNVICFSSSSGLTKLLNKNGFNVGKEHTLLAGELE